MPPSLREWLPANHLAGYVLDAVAEWTWRRFIVVIGWMGGVGRRMSRR
jgi:hypothetical protein